MANWPSNLKNFILIILILVVASCSKGKLKICQRINAEGGIENTPLCNFQFNNLEFFYDKDGFLDLGPKENSKQKIILAGDGFVSDEFKSTEMKLEKLLNADLFNQYSIYNFGIRDVQIALLAEKLTSKIYELKPSHLVLFIDGAHMVGKSNLHKIDPFRLCPMHEFILARNENYLIGQLEKIIPYLVVLNQIVKEVNGKLIIMWAEHSSFNTQGIFSAISSCTLLKRTLPNYELNEQKIRKIFEKENLEFGYVKYQKDEKKGVINQQLVNKLKVLL